MALVVEDGTGKPSATGYITEAALWDYAPTSATVPGGADPSAAIVRASQWIDAHYGARFNGERLNGREQGLAWPRIGAYDTEGNPVASNAVPPEVAKATAEAALREMATPGMLNPDDAGGSVVRRKKLGSMEVEYAVSDGSRRAKPTFPVIDGILAPLLGYSSPYFGRAVRA